MDIFLSKSWQLSWFDSKSVSFKLINELPVFALGIYRSNRKMKKSQQDFGSILTNILMRLTISQPIGTNQTVKSENSIAASGGGSWMILYKRIFHFSYSQFKYCHSRNLQQDCFIAHSKLHNTIRQNRIMNSKKVSQKL